MMPGGTHGSVGRESQGGKRSKPHSSGGARWGDPAGEAHRQVPAGRGSECAGRNSDERPVEAPKDEGSERRARTILAKAAGDSQDRPWGNAARRGKGDGTRTRTWVESGKGSSPRREIRRKQGSRASRKAKRGEGESLAEGPVVARTRVNARRAKGPCRGYSVNEGRRAG